MRSITTVRQRNLDMRRYIEVNKVLRGEWVEFTPHELYLLSSMFTEVLRRIGMPHPEERVSTYSFYKDRSTGGTIRITTTEQPHHKNLKEILKGKTNFSFLTTHLEFLLDKSKT